MTTKGTDATELTETTKTDETVTPSQHLSRADTLTAWLDATGADKRHSERYDRREVRDPMGSDLGQQMYDWAATVRWLIERERARS
jgi:hypothetical protein